MSIHVLHRDPRVAASLLINEDVLQACLGAAQVLGTVHRQYGELTFNTKRGQWETAAGRKAYAPYDMDEEIAWACETAGNYAWVRRYFAGALEEYQHRWGDAGNKRHASWRVYEALKEPPRALRARCLGRPDEMTAFLPPANSNFPPDTDVVHVHRTVYRDTRLKRHAIPAYTRREIPDFMKTT